MAYAIEQWEKTRAYYEAGLSLSQINEKTGISRSKISERAKKEQWEQGANADIIESTVKNEVKKGTLNGTALKVVNEIIDEKTRHLTFLHNATLKNISVMAKKLNEDASISDHKTAQDAIHKAGQTLGVIEQFAKSGDVNVNATAAVQNNTVKTLDDFYK